MRQNLGAKPTCYPQAVFMIATYNEDGSANIMNAAWGGITGPNEITLSLNPAHKTTKNFLRTNALTISMGDAPHAEACDYLGMVSGDKAADKVAKAGFTTSKSEFVDAPVINELAICMECKVKTYEADKSRLIAEIVNVSVDTSALTDGRVDVSKVRPIIFDSFNGCYCEIGKPVCGAFSGGKKYM